MEPRYGAPIDGAEGTADASEESNEDNQSHKEDLQTDDQYGLTEIGDQGTASKYIIRRLY